MYRRGGIPEYLVENGPDSDGDNQESEQTDDDDESDYSHNPKAEAYDEAMEWAQEKEVEAIAQEQKLKPDL
ncbi:hypothetical protein KCU95_g3595, partial [Aureobasidium melanogenum]